VHSKVSQIIEALIGKIRNIESLDFRSNNGVSTVEAFSREYTEIPDDQFPHFSVIYAGDDSTEEPGNVYETVNFNITISFKDTSELEIADWIAKVKNAILEDIRLGLPFVHKTFYPGTTVDDGVIPPYRVVNMSLITIYTYRKGEA